MSSGRELPSGIVAFVFSDIEGSTRLFRRLGDRYIAVLERHNELLRRAWAAHGGADAGSAMSLPDAIGLADRVLSGLAHGPATSPEPLPRRRSRGIG